MTRLRALAALALATALAACTASPPATNTSGPAGPTTAGSTARPTASAPPTRPDPQTPAAADAAVTPLAVPAPDRALAAAHHLRIVSTLYWSPALRRERQVLLLLPDAYYRRPSARFPVVEFLHGHSGDPLNLITPSLGDLEGTATGPGIGTFIGVMPDGNGPLYDDSWWANVWGQPMGTAVTRDLRRWVAAHLRVSGRWSYAGLSSGGYGAAYLPTVDRAPVYGECGLSGFYDSLMPPIPQNYTPTQRIPYTPEAHAAAAPGIVFLAYGRADTATKVQTLAYAADLRRAGHPFTLRTYPGGHQWSVWRAGFADCLRRLVPAA